MGVHEKDVARPMSADWLSAKAWGEVCRAANVSAAFAKLPQDIADAPGAWGPLFDAVSGAAVHLSCGVLLMALAKSGSPLHALPRGTVGPSCGGHHETTSESPSLPGAPHCCRPSLTP